MMPAQTDPDSNLCVLIAGGTRGTGLATAQALAARGASVSLCGRNSDDVDEAVASLRSQFATDVAGHALDLSVPAARARWIDEAAHRWGRIDGLVANAGANLGPDQWLANLGANLGWVSGACNDTRRHLALRGGSIVVLSSIASRLTELGPELVPYAASKAALERFAVGLAHAWGPDGIRVNVVSPGPIVGGGGYWDKQVQDEPGEVEAVATRAALGRLVTADEVASAVAFLVGPLSGGTTGATLVVDAGLSIGGRP